MRSGGAGLFDPDNIKCPRTPQPADVSDGRLLVDEALQRGLDGPSYGLAARRAARPLEQIVIDLDKPLGHENEYIRYGPRDIPLVQS